MTTYTTNPLNTTIGEAEELITNLHDAARRLQNAIQLERVARARAQDAKETLSASEAELIHEATLLAQAKEGPLSGIATTSKAYGYAIEKLLSEARQTNLSALYHDANRLAIEADNAAIELEQAKVQFSACKHVADLKAAILSGMTGRY